MIEIKVYVYVVLPLRSFVEKLIAENSAAWYATRREWECSWEGDTHTQSSLLIVIGE